MINNERDTRGVEEQMMVVETIGRDTTTDDWWRKCIAKTYKHTNIKTKTMLPRSPQLSPPLLLPTQGRKVMWGSVLQQLQSFYIKIYIRF